MKLTNCPTCGKPLEETNYGRMFCPNCGIIEEIKEESETKEVSYIN